MGMRRAVGGCILALGLSLAIAGTVEPAYACSCAVTPAAASPAATDVVFVGRAIRTRPVPAGTYSAEMVAVGFVTRESTDGAPLGFEQVLTPASTAACGYSFAIGKTYQIVARHAANGNLLTDSCSATQLTTQNIPVVGYPIDPGPQRPGDLAILIGLAVIGALTTGGIVLIRRLLTR
jgi:hypothetical protein